MADLVIINKSESIARCLKRISEDYLGSESLKGDFMRQDAIILNPDFELELCNET